MEDPKWLCWGGRRTADTARTRNEQWGEPGMLVCMNLSPKGLMYLVSNRLLEILNEGRSGQVPVQKFRFTGEMSRVFRHPDSDELLYTVVAV